MTEENTREYDIPSAQNEPDEEDVKIYDPNDKESNFENTKVLDFGHPETPGQTASDNKTDEVDGQLTFEGMIEEEEPEQEPPAPVEPVKTPEEEMEEALQKNRQDKIANFKLISNEPKKPLSEVALEEEMPLQPEPFDEPEETEQEDYQSYAETAAVRGELQYRCRNAKIGLLVTGAAEFVLLCLMIMAQVSVTLPMEAITYLTINLVLLVVMMLAAHRVIADGVMSLFRWRSSADTVTALASFAAVIHNVLQYLNLTEVSNGHTVLYNAVIGLALLLSLLGRQYRLTRIYNSFRMVSHEGDKFAVCVADDEIERDQIGRFLQKTTAPKVVYPHRSHFLSGFMANSYDEEGHEPLFQWFSPAVIGFALLFSVGYILFGGEVGNWWNAVGVFTSLLCVASPAFAVAGANLPFCRVGRRLLQRGTMLIGWKAVTAFSDTDVLTLDASDVFSGDTVLLHGIKTFSGARIDEAILDAAAVSIAAGGPLAGVFRRVIENRLDMLQDVDTLLYEQEMGLSGWVGGRRVLVGNRRLLENHGVDVPSHDYESRYTKDGRQLVYLSTGGELCAMFVVSYTVSPDVKNALSSLCRSGVSLLIRTCDPNVTQEMFCELFELDADAVRITDTAIGRIFESLTYETAERSEALIAYCGRTAGLGFALASCNRLYRRVKVTGILQMIASGLGAVGVAIAVALQSPFMPFVLMLHLLLWAVITGLVARTWIDF